MSITGRRAPQTAELIPLLMALLLVLLIAVLSYRGWVSFGRRSDQFAITRQVADGTNALLSSLKDAETGQRGFLLTGEDRYLEPYRRALTEIPAQLNTLVELTAIRRPDQAQRLQALRAPIAEKLEELRQTIEQRQHNHLDAALSIVQSDRGLALMNQIAASCSEIQSAAYGRLTEYSEDTRSSANLIGLIGTAGSIVLLALLLFSTVTIRRGTRNRYLLMEKLRQHDAQSSATRDLLQTTIGSIGDGVIATDAEGRVTLLNAIAESLTGWTQAEAKGLPVEQIFVLRDEENGGAAENPVRKALREGRIVGLANETDLIARDRRRIPIDDSAAPIRDAQENLVGAVFVFRDITERREAEREQKKAAVELAKRSDLLQRTNTELQHFAYAASHDLREPLRTITAYTELVQLRGDSHLDDQSKESMRFILAAAHRMGALIDALLDYSKAGEIAHSPARVVDMEAILARALANLHGSLEENKAVVTHDALPTVLGDETHFEQLFQNLVSNALKYRRQEVPRIHIGVRAQGEEWLFWVSDNGQGIPLQYHAQIFELFKRLHGQQYPGAGIGLATCKKIVERYGGRIWVESESGNGSRFFFSVPAMTGSARNASAS